MMAARSVRAALALWTVVAATTALPQGPPPPLKGGVTQPLNDCPEVTVAAGQPEKYIFFEDILTLYVQPSQPKLLLSIILGNRRLQAKIDGPRMELEECHSQLQHAEQQQDAWQQQQEVMCMPLSDWEVKNTTPLLAVNTYNTITVSLVAGQVMVAVGGASGARVTTEGQGTQAQVLVLTPTDCQQGHLNDPSCYQAQVKLFCNSTVNPMIELDHSTTTQQPITIPPPPFPNCPQYQVEQLSNLTSIKITNNLTLAVFPSHPNLYFKIFYHDVVFKASVEGTMVKLESCGLTKQPQECQVKDEGGTKDRDILHTNSWNFVSISVDNDKVWVDINMKQNVMAMVNPGKEGPDHMVVLSSNPSYEQFPRPTMYTVLVNIDCTETSEPGTSVMPPYTTDHPHVSSPAPIVEEKEEGSSMHVVGIVVGVLAVVLVALAIAFAVHSYHTRRTARINQHQPLQETQQQQQQ